METSIQWHGGMHFTAVADSGFEVDMDGPPDIGGANLGVRPMEMMLMGMGGCSAVDVIHILRRARQDVTACSAKLTATRAASDPKVFESIHVHYSLSGSDLNPQKIERAIELSATKYCSASLLMTRAGVNVTHDFEIADEGSA